MLFAHRRPRHLRRTLESLAANPEAAHSRLYIYADAARRQAEAAAVLEARAVLRERAWCGEVKIFEAPEHLGLAENIVHGITERLREDERLIVLEDDLELAPGFLRYLNEALRLYENDERVATISGWMPDVTTTLPETFFLKTMSSWGWGTWRRAWAQYRPEAAALAREIVAAGRKAEFNLEGGYDYFTQLELNAQGRLKTWGVLNYASAFLRDRLTLHPHLSLVRNIGLDELGTHARPDPRFVHRTLAESVAVVRTEVQAHEGARAAFRAHLRGTLEWRCRQAARKVRRRLAKLLPAIGVRPAPSKKAAFP